MDKMLIFGDDYRSGKRVLSRESLVKDIMLYGGITTETMYLIIENVTIFARGDYQLQLGRLLRYRHEIIASRLN